MIINLRALFLLGVVTTSLHWLIARSDIARPLWSRARGWVAKLLSCPACSGYWLGGIVAPWLHPFGVMDTLWSYAWKSVLSGIVAMVLTPIFEGVMVWGLHESAIEETVIDVAELADPGLTESGDKTPNQRPPMI